MDQTTRGYIDRVDAACRRMASTLAASNRATIHEIEHLSAEISAERQKVADLEEKLELAECQIAKLQNHKEELAKLKAARAKDLRDLASVLDEMAPLVGGGIRA